MAGHLSHRFLLSRRPIQVNTVLVLDYNLLYSTHSTKFNTEGYTLYIVYNVHVHACMQLTHSHCILMYMYNTTHTLPPVHPPALILTCKLTPPVRVLHIHSTCTISTHLTFSPLPSHTHTHPHTHLNRTQEEMVHTCRGTVNLAGAFIDTIDATNFVITNGPSQVCWDLT